MTEYAEIRLAELSALHWALKLPTIRDGRGTRDRAAHELLHFLALHADFKTGRGAFPSVESMADAIGSDRVNVRRKLAGLEELGIIRAMSVEDMAELLEERKAAQGKTAETDWLSMSGGLRDYYEHRFDPEEGGQTPWELAVDDESLWDRMAKDDEERQLSTRDRNLNRHKRYNAKRYGTPPPDCDNEPVSQRHPTTVATTRDPRRNDNKSPSYDNEPVSLRRRSAPLSPSNPHSTAQVTATDRPATPTPPAAPGGERLHSPASGESTGPAWVRGLENAFAAGMVSRQELERIVDLENELAGRVAGRG